MQVRKKFGSEVIEVGVALHRRVLYEPIVLWSRANARVRRDVKSRFSRIIEDFRSPLLACSDRGGLGPRPTSDMESRATCVRL